MELLQLLIQLLVLGCVAAAVTLGRCVDIGWLTSLSLSTAAAVVVWLLLLLFLRLLMVLPLLLLT